MDVKALQAALGVTADGMFGPVSRAALINRFTNPQAPAVSANDIEAVAFRLGCTAKQVRAVASVESAGSGYDAIGRPKILFERHLFHRLTGGRWSTTAFSDPAGGGYGQSSWEKLALACARDPDAAFGACSWGKFQVLGLHWSRLGYSDSFALARSTVGGEAAHYDLLARYVEAFGLKEEMRAISINPETCRAFAKGYNGPGYERFAYHTKLAGAMR